MRRGRCEKQRKRCYRHMTILSFHIRIHSTPPPPHIHLQVQPTHLHQTYPPSQASQPADRQTDRPSRRIRYATPLNPSPITHPSHPHHIHITSTAIKITCQPTLPPLTSHLATVRCKSRTYPYLYLTYSNEGTAHTTKGPT